MTLQPLDSNILETNIFLGIDKEKKLISHIAYLKKKKKTDDSLKHSFKKTIEEPPHFSWQGILVFDPAYFFFCDVIVLW